MFTFYIIKLFRFLCKAVCLLRLYFVMEFIISAMANKHGFGSQFRKRGFDIKPEERLCVNAGHWGREFFACRLIGLFCNTAVDSLQRLINIEITALVNIRIKLIGMSQHRIACCGTFNFIVLQSSQHFMVLIISHSHTHPAHAVNKGIKCGNRLYRILSCRDLHTYGSAYAPAD